MEVSNKEITTGHSQFFKCDTQYFSFTIVDVDVEYQLLLRSLSSKSHIEYLCYS